MAHIEKVMINGILTDVEKLDHSAQQVDDGVGRALPGGEIDASLSNKVNVNGGTVGDLDTRKTTGLYTWLDNTNAFGMGTNILFDLVVSGPNFSLYEQPSVVQELICTSPLQHAGRTLKRTYYFVIGWTPWVEQATATPPQEFELPLENGWGASDAPALFSRDQFGRCRVSVNVLRSTPVVGEHKIASLPEGYRPNRIYRYAAALSGGAVGFVCIVGSSIYVYAFGETIGASCECDFWAT